MTKTRFFIAFSCCILFSSVYAANVNPDDAFKVALNVSSMMNRSELRSHTTTQLELVKQRTGDENYYIFNINENDGFVIVSGDDIAVPVLGYVPQGSYDPDNVPPAFSYWMSFLQKEIAFALNNNFPENEETKKAWDELLNENPASLRSSIQKLSVEPFLKTKWGQDDPFNNLCPLYVREGKTVRAVTGCTATAMAQVMKYYNHPEQGKGMSKVYTVDHLEMELPSTSYEVFFEWDKMKEQYTYSQDSDNAVATLMYLCAISLESVFGIGNVNSTGANSTDIPNVLKNHFYYDPAIGYEERVNYTSREWNALLMEQLDARRPVVYSANGHAFVCDGYDGYGLFHFNWGWEGACDGFYATSGVALIAGSMSTPFSDESQKAVMNIMPGNTESNNPITLNSDLTSSLSSVEEGEEFTVNSTIRNNSAATLSCEMGIAVVDDNDRVTLMLSQEKSFNIVPGNNEIELNALHPILPPGKYKLKMVVKHKTGGWVVVSGNNLFIDFLELNVEKRDAKINLYGESRLTSSAKEVVREAEFTVTAWFINNSDVYFRGELDAALLDGSDNIIEIIGCFGTNIILAPGAILSNIYGTAKCKISKNVSPGNYRIKTIVKPIGKQEYTIVNGEKMGQLDFVLIKAKEEICYDMRLDKNLKTSKTTVNKGEVFSVDVGWVYIGYEMFNRELALALTDDDNNIIEIISPVKVYDPYFTRRFDETYLALVPLNTPSGRYKLRFIFRPVNGTIWGCVPGLTDKIVDYIDITVTDNITLEEDKSNLLVQRQRTNPEILTEGNPAAFIPTMYNWTPNGMFVGNLELGLYKETNEGLQLVQTIETKFTILSAYGIRDVQFYTPSLDAPPGQYKALLFQEILSGERKLVQNDFPITIEPSGEPTFVTLASSASFSVYPNPAMNSIHIHSENSPVLSVKMYDLLGKLIKNETFPDSKDVVISVTELPKGIYLMNIYFDNGMKVERIMIE